MPYSVEDMVRAGCTTRRGVRYWEEQGLLGTVERSDGGTRRYTHEQLSKARIIAAAQFGNFSLEEISKMLAAYSVDPTVYEALVIRLSDQTRAAVRLLENLPKPETSVVEFDLDAIPPKYDL